MSGVSSVIYSPAGFNENEKKIIPFNPPIDFETAGKRADEIMNSMTLEDKIEMISGENSFFIKGLEKYGLPQLYLSDATQGVHIRKELSNQIEKTTAFPCPICLTSTWNTDLAEEYARCIGEECRAGDIAVLLGPGMNIYRISQNGRNFEYFGEDPFLAARMIENYVIGMQSTGTIATLKHFVANNTDHRRRTSNSMVDERTLHEIYTPAFKAGIDAGALAVMTSYNQVNGEWAGQSKELVAGLLRNDFGFKWLVMSDWWSVWHPEKTITSGLDLDMPGDTHDNFKRTEWIEEVSAKFHAKRLLDEGKISEADIDRMVKSIIRTEIAMGLLDRSVKDESFLENFSWHEEIAIQTAREGIILLRNENNILPVKPEQNKRILLTGEYSDKTAMGGGSAAVEGFDHKTILEVLKSVYGENLIYEKNPTDEQIKNADVVFLSIGTDDSEGWDSPFEFSPETDQLVVRVASLNPNTIVIVNSGGGRKMSHWNENIAGLIYAWYPGQRGNEALAEIISGKVNPSAKLPVSIEKQFSDSPGYGYMPDGDTFYEGWDGDMNMSFPVYDIRYEEGVFVGYRWYEHKNIKPLYPFGFGLSYTGFEIRAMNLSASEMNEDGEISVSVKIKNTGPVEGAEVVQLYIQDMEASVSRPEKELKGFRKVALKPGESKKVIFNIRKEALSFWDVNSHKWKAEKGRFKVMAGNSSDNILCEKIISLV